MRIDGAKIAEEIKAGLLMRIEELTQRGITPKIAIITLGDESSWEAYVRQKIKVASELGITAELINLKDADQVKLIETIKKIDDDKSYHGVIVQRPMPPTIERLAVVEAISKKKDVDGFRTDSMFKVPVWLAVKRLVEQATAADWNTQKFVVIGKGETAGGPIARGLTSLGIKPTVVDSKTENPESITKQADVIITCVGKSHVVTKDNIKNGAIVIGVGTHDENGKIRGDFEESEIENIAGSFTPTPGGVGPVNLSYLFSNLIQAAKNLSSN